MFVFAGPVIGTVRNRSTHPIQYLHSLYTNNESAINKHFLVTSILDSIHDSIDIIINVGKEISFFAWHFLVQADLNYIDFSGASVCHRTKEQTSHLTLDCKQGPIVVSVECKTIHCTCSTVPSVPKYCSQIYINWKTYKTKLYARLTWPSVVPYIRPR